MPVQFTGCGAVICPQVALDNPVSRFLHVNATDSVGMASESPALSCLNLCSLTCTPRHSHSSLVSLLVTHPMLLYRNTCMPQLLVHTLPIELWYTNTASPCMRPHAHTRQWGTGLVWHIQQHSIPSPARCTQHSRQHILLL